MIVGFASFLVMVGIVVAAAAQFRGDFTETAPITVMADRAGLLMSPGARVKLHGAQIGSVAAVKETADGRAELQLAIDPTRLQLMPDNTLVQISSATVFGTKSVEFETPANPSTTPLRAGQVLDSQHVTVEVNTTSSKLNSVLSLSIRPSSTRHLVRCRRRSATAARLFGRSLTDSQLVFWPSRTESTRSWTHRTPDSF